MPQDFIHGNRQGFQGPVGRHAPMVRTMALRRLYWQIPSLKDRGLSDRMHRTVFMEARNAVLQSGRYRKALRKSNIGANLMSSLPFPVRRISPARKVPHP